MNNKTKFDWRILKRYLGSQGSDDISNFLEKLPQNVGHPILIAGGIAWLSFCTLFLFTMFKTTELTELRAELIETTALKPNVPSLKDTPVSSKHVNAFVKKIKFNYPDLTFSVTGNTILIIGADTRAFPQFREVMGHLQNGGHGWRPHLVSMCVGRECDKDKLRATVKINKVKVEKQGND